MNRTTNERKWKMGKIRSYCASINFPVIGKLKLMGKWNHCNRWYMDEGQNAYLIDESIGTIRIIALKKGRSQ